METASAAARRQIRTGAIRGPTAGLAPGFAQANIAIVPADAAEGFANFCEANARLSGSGHRP